MKIDKGWNESYLVVEDISVDSVVVLRFDFIIIPIAIIETTTNTNSTFFTNLGRD